MSSTYGERIKLSVFGQSHGAAVGMTMDGIPAGLPVDFDTLSEFLSRRAPGKNEYSTPRREADAPEFLSGIQNGYTCGAPISAVIRNTNTKSTDYSDLSDCPRPGHADFPARIKYRGFEDASGGGHFSGRLTAPLCIAGGLCLQWLDAAGIKIRAHILSISDVDDAHFDPLCPELDRIGDDFPTLDLAAGEKMKAAIADARADGDSVGGIIECAATGLPVGIGEPMFGGMESRIAAAVYGIPAVKGVDFGAGFNAAAMLGSENNDPYTTDGAVIRTKTNNAGGILGGLTTGMPLIFRAAFKPTPSIAKQQDSISFARMENRTLQITGRHDPCIVPRAVPVVEAAAALAIFDAYLISKDKI